MQTLRGLLCPVNSRAKTCAVLRVVLVLALCVPMAAPPITPLSSGTAKAAPMGFSPDDSAATFFASHLKTEAAINQMPLNFTLNQGQTDARVKFTARGRGYNLFLTPTEAVMALQKAQGTMALRMQLLHANSHPVITGLDQLPMVSNYYLGNDPKKYRAAVPHFAKVKYTQMYPGIDVVYYGNQQQLEYDFIVAPGADPNAIQMKFAGATKLRIAANGDLVISLKGGELRHHKPIIYQTIDDERKEIVGHFVIRHRNQVGFVIGEYDATKELVIDPTLIYSTYLGGYEGDEKAYAVAVKSGCTGACDSYITGEVASLTFPDTNIPPMPPFITPGSAGGKDVFVAKMNPTGTGIAFFTFLGGTGDEHGRGIKVDGSGNSYVVGVMGSNIDFNSVSGYQTTDPATNDDDAFVAKLDALGALTNFTYLGGSGPDQANGVVLDAANNVCVAGQTHSPNFPTAAAYDNTHPGYWDAFVSKLSNDLGTLSYSTYLGGYNMDYANGIDTYNGILYVVGNTQSSDFPTSPNGFDKKLTGFAPVDAFVARLDPTAGTGGLLYSTFLGGNGREYGYGIAINQNNGQFYVCGRSHATGASTVGYTQTSNGFPVTPSALQSTQAGYGDVFLTRFNPSGSNILYSTLLGGSDFDCAYGIQVRGTTAYLVGETDSSNAGTPFPTTGNRFQDDQLGTDAFFAKIDTSASGLVFSTYFGGGDADYFDVQTDSARGIVLAGVQAYVVGFTNSESTASGGSFPIKPAIPYQENIAGAPNAQNFFDCFVVRINTN